MIVKDAQQIGIISSHIVSRKNKKQKSPPNIVLGNNI